MDELFRHRRPFLSRVGGGAPRRARAGARAEMACLDRCVPKYLETHELVGKEIDTVRRAFLGMAAAGAAAQGGPQ